MIMGVNFANDIQLIKEAILNNIEVKSIYLFGSYAYGTPTENSDIDIYTVLPDKYDNTTEIYAKIITELSDKNIFFIDLLLVPEKVFDSRKNKYILETTIFNRGKILYESQ
jgi:predicted nucleotidyltransferase